MGRLFTPGTYSLELGVYSHDTGQDLNVLRDGKVPIGTTARFATQRRAGFAAAHALRPANARIASAAVASASRIVVPV